MSDPTFSTRYGLAVQAELLRQAAKDQRRHRALSPEHLSHGPAWPLAVARRLAIGFRTLVLRQKQRGASLCSIGQTMPEGKERLP